MLARRVTVASPRGSNTMVQVRALHAEGPAIDQADEAASPELTPALVADGVPLGPEDQDLGRCRRCTRSISLHRRDGSRSPGATRLSRKAGADLTRSSPCLPGRVGRRRLALRGGNGLAVPRNWITLRVELVGRRDVVCDPPPRRIMLVGPGHTFAHVAQAVDAAFGRWNLAHLHSWPTAVGSPIRIRTGTRSTSWASGR